MNPKNTWILVLLAGGLFAFIFFFERRIHGPAPIDTRVLPDFKAAEVTSIQVQPLRQLEIRADLTNGLWQLTHPLPYPAQGGSVQKLLRGLEGLNWQTRISAQELMGQPNSDEEYGFDSPQFTLIIQQGPDLRQIKLGNRTAPGDQVYVQVVGMEGVDIVGADILSLIPNQVNDWRNTSFAGLDGQAFNRLDVTAGTAGFELQRETTNDLWRMTRPMPARVDNAKIEALLEQLRNLRVSKFETDDPKTDLDPLGLQPPELELDFSQGTNPVVALQFGKSPTNNASVLYARHGGQNTIVLVPQDQIAPWRAPAADFRDRHLAGPLVGGLDAIDVQVRGQESFSVQRLTNNAWRVVSPQAFPADPKLMQNFIGMLANLEIVPVAGEFAVKNVVTESDLAGYDLADPVRKYILKRAATNAAGDPTNTVLVELDFGLKDTNVVARRPDESSVYAVKLEDFQRLPDSSLSLRKRQIWDFSVDNVTRVRIRQNGQWQELLHKGPNRWTIAAGSQGIINEFAVEAGTEELGSLEAEKWIDPGDQDRAKFGFSDQSLEFVVDVADGGQTRTLALDLGSWSADQHRYGEVRLDGQNWIFEVPQNLLDRVFSDFNIHESAGP